LVAENRRRSKQDPEFELLDTGIFNDDAYFDVFVEYAKASTEDLLIKLTIHNRGREAASLHVLPTLWFRNTWAWGYDSDMPVLTQTGEGIIQADHKTLGCYMLYCGQEPVELLFTGNETNMPRLYQFD